jgi:hypothetical protein
MFKGYHFGFQSTSADMWIWDRTNDVSAVATDAFKAKKPPNQWFFALFDKLPKAL